MHQSVDFHELVALYAVSDSCVVASTRDGMNLVSFEYVACQAKRHGTMILSEFAGSAQSLTGSVIVNPWNTSDMARAMYQAVTMGEEERAQRFELMNAYVQNNTRYACPCCEVIVPCFVNLATADLSLWGVVRSGASLSSRS